MGGIFWEVLVERAAHIYSAISPGLTGTKAVSHASLRESGWHCGDAGGYRTGRFISDRAYVREELAVGSLVSLTWTSCADVGPETMFYANILTSSMAQISGNRRWPTVLGSQAESEMLEWLFTCGCYKRGPVNADNVNPITIT